MYKKFFVLAILFSVLEMPCVAAPEPPQRGGQWAYVLGDTFSIYAKADKNSQSHEIKRLDEWLAVLDAIRDKNNYLWYKVKINGEQVWLFQEGIRLKMGGKNKKASDVYSRCSNIRSKVMNGTMSGWDKEQNGNFLTYTSKNGSFMVSQNGNKVEDIYFKAHGESTCTAFLGFNALGMDRNALRKKFGAPTMRETPIGEPDVNILSYELSSINMTLAMYLRKARGDKEARVERMELYKGKTGDNDYVANEDTENYYSETIDHNASEGDSDYDVPDDLPDDDVPVETPEKSSKKASSKISLSSEDDASEFLQELLTELEKIDFREELEYLGQVEIDGEECFEFSSQFNLSETGRYAVSSGGKIYEHDGENYTPVK